MSNAELFKALQMFNDGVQQAATTSAVNDATKAMQQIQTGITDEAEQRRALDQLSRETALRLTGTGANGAQINSAFQAIAPQNFGSAEQMQLEGMARGSAHLTNTAGSIIKQRTNEKNDLLAYENALQMRLQDRRAMHELLMTKGKAAGKQLVAPGFEFTPGYTPTEKDVEDLKMTSAAYSTVTSDLKRLDSMVEKYGTEFATVPGFGGQDKAEMLQTKEAMLLQLKEMEKLGALAGPDVDVLAKVMPDPTTFRTNKYKQQSQNFKSILENRIKMRAKARGARWLGGSAIEEMENSNIQVKRYQGREVRVMEVAPGKFQVLED
jgi:hypothetical protein